MRKDWHTWSVHINAHRLTNWSIGLDYYHEYAYVPVELMARVFQVNLLFFNVTITRWQNNGWT